MGRARWGASGALYSQSALARLNSHIEVLEIQILYYFFNIDIRRLYSQQPTPTRQVRKEATESNAAEVFAVPSEGVKIINTACNENIEDGCTALLLSGRWFFGW